MSESSSSRATRDGLKELAADLKSGKVVLALGNDYPSYKINEALQQRAADFLVSALSETRTKTAGAQADAHNRKGGDIEDLSRVLTEDYSLWHGEDEHDHLGNIAGFVGRFEAEIERLKTSAPLSAIGRVMQEDASQLADMAGNARRYRAWRDGDVLVRRSPESGWEARHRDTPHWDVGSWHWSQSLDEVIDKAMKDGGPL